MLQLERAGEIRSGNYDQHQTHDLEHQPAARANARAGCPPQPGAEAGVLKVIDAFLAQEGPAIVVLQEVPSKNGKYPGPESDPVFIGHLKQLGCYILFDSSEKGETVVNSFFKTVVACRAINVKKLNASDDWRKSRHIPFRVTLGDRSATFLALHADSENGLSDVLDHLASWSEAACPRLVLVGDFNANGEGRKAIKGFVDAYPEGDTRIEHHSPDTVMYRGVSVGDVAVDCECGWSDHYPLACTVKLQRLGRPLYSTLLPTYSNSASLSFAAAALANFLLTGERPSCSNNTSIVSLAASPSVRAAWPLRCSSTTLA